MNLRSLAFKLQAALLARGRIVKIDQRQVWFREAKRMGTKYIVRENMEVLLETFKIVDVVQFLAGELGDSS